MIVKLNGRYQTKDGGKVRLVSDQGSKAYPFIGYVDNDDEPTTWNASGKEYNDGDESNYDLIEYSPSPLEAAARKCIDTRHHLQDLEKALDELERIINEQ